MITEIWRDISLHLTFLSVSGFPVFWMIRGGRGFVIETLGRKFQSLLLSLILLK